MNKEGNKDNLKDEISKIPNDQYACPKENCKLVPEINNINYESGKLEINCPTHGIINIDIKDYFNQEIKNIYYSCACKISKIKQKNRLSAKEIFNYDCKSKEIYCLQCIEQQKKNEKKSFIKVNEINDKCHEHLKDNEKYCFKCKKHFCSDKNCICIHKDDIKEIKEANKENIEKIKDKKGELIKNKELQEYLIKLLDTLIDTYEKHPHNYFNTINIKNISKNFNEVNNEPKIPLVQVNQNDKNRNYR